MNDQDLKMFGCYREYIDADLANCIGPKEMYAMSILSDAQEVLAHGNAETARQFMNKAKYVMSVVIEEKLGGV